eukprot:Sspe_Gene.100198::Locus_74924_Transcript_1_1_Confidence_1.000_Length_1065::g.100198::m.100198
MTTVSTKHNKPVATVPQPTKVGTKGTIIDDMDKVNTVEMPLRHSKQTNECHSVVLGVDSSNPYVSLKRQDYDVKQLPTRDRDRDQQRQRVIDMNTKHFTFGNAPMTRMSELRGTLLPPTKDVLMQREIRPIGGPNNKGASNIFLSQKDREEWQNTVCSTSRADYKNTAAARPKVDTAAHIRQMRGTHFTIGNDTDPWSSTVRSDFKSLPLSSSGPVPATSTGSSVPIATGKRPTEKMCSVNRGQYGIGAGEIQPREKLLPQMDLRRTNMVLGYDPAQFTTESRGVFKPAKFVPATDTKPPVQGFVATSPKAMASTGRQ